MNDPCTVEVNPDELSEEVVEELVEEGEIDEEKAEEWGEKVWLEEVDTAEPNRTGVREYLNRHTQNMQEIASDTKEYLSDYSTAVVKINSVERNHNDKIVVESSHAELGKFVTSFEPDSETLANLMAYHKVDSPAELEDKTLLIHPSSFQESGGKILIPHNVSPSGKVRFKLYSTVTEIRQKTRIGVLSDSPRDFMDLIFVCGILSCVPAAAGSVVHDFSTTIAYILAVPLILVCTVLVLAVSYWLYRVLLYLVGALLNSRFEERSI